MAKRKVRSNFQVMLLLMTTYWLENLTLSFLFWSFLFHSFIWQMQDHFWHLCFESFPMVWRLFDYHNSFGYSIISKSPWNPKAVNTTFQPRNWVNEITFKEYIPSTWVYKILEVLTQSMVTLGFQITSPNELFNLTNPIETQAPSKGLHPMQVLI
jgi:hypothetical protein